MNGGRKAPRCPNFEVANATGLPATIGGPFLQIHQTLPKGSTRDGSSRLRDCALDQTTYRWCTIRIRQPQVRRRRTGAQTDL